MSDLSHKDIKSDAEISDTESRDCIKNTVLSNTRKRSLSQKCETLLPSKKAKSDDEHDNKSESSHGIKSSNGSSSTPDPASTPDEDRSDMGENGNLEHVTLFWFTEAALRMHDNPGLKAAVKGCKAVRFCYFLDERFVSESSPRWKFIKSALNDIDDQLKKLGSRLHVLSGQPSEELPRIFAEWHVVRLGFSSHPGCGEMRLRDRAIVSLALRHGVEVVYREAPHCLFTPRAVIKAAGGMPPLTFKRYLGILPSISLPGVPLPVPESDIVMTSVSDDHDEIPCNEILLTRKDENDEFPWHGGETEAKSRFHQAMKMWRETKSKSPDLRQLTPYIIQGCLSVRQVYHDLNHVYNEIHGMKADLKLHMAALHRDFLYCLSSVSVTEELKLDIQFDNDKKLTNAWLTGQTGFPWVDAVVRQMRTEGWTPPLLRQSALWFLTRGVLWQSPQIGIEFLSEHCLMDLPLARGFTNWAAGVGAWVESELPHKCPKVDPNYIRKWVPEVKDLSDEQIAEPWSGKMPSNYAPQLVPHKQSHRQAQAKFGDSLKLSSNKLLCRLDQLGRNGKRVQPIVLEPSPWEMVQPCPTSFLNHAVTGLSGDITQQTFVQYIQKTQQVTF